MKERDEEKSVWGREKVGRVAKKKKSIKSLDPPHNSFSFLSSVPNPPTRMVAGAAMVCVCERAGVCGCVLGVGAG